METKIPETLYRGVVIKYPKLKDFHFFGVDFTSVEKTISDTQNKRTDGNEVGIYMSDNQSMVYSAYGNVHNSGTSLSNTIRVGLYQTIIGVPDVGICYEIKTQGLNIKKPFVSSALMGHYNNGFQGDEYIADFIPQENITVTRIQIGSDYLHDEEFIDVSDIALAEMKTKQIIEERKRHLQALLSVLEKMHPKKRKLLSEPDQRIFRCIFGKNGVRWIQKNDINLTDAAGIITRLLFDYYHNNIVEIDFKNLIYLDQLRNRLAKTDNPNSTDSLLGLIEQDILRNQNSKENFIKRKQEEGKPVNTSSFDSKDEMLSSMQRKIESLQKEQSERKVQEEKKKKNAVLIKIEQMLQIRITPTKGYMFDPKRFNGVPYSILKTAQELEQEEAEIIKEINRRYLSGAIDLGTANIMKKVIIEEFESMKQNSIQPEEFTEPPKAK